ncbi:papilin-like isoform X2 [Aphis craccivora]|uniref:Papilin-like isoform X2 n=1 Tax=Aphis craccivora TaxID=307492 RepID=A0A6G0Z783_APHCR|nr:papilin-like isoform X2 [Aphis craccivora]
MVFTNYKLKQFKRDILGVKKERKKEVSRIDRCSSADDPPPPAADSSPPAADPTPPAAAATIAATDATKTATDSTATDPNATNPTVTDPTAAAAAADDKPSMFSQCKTLMYKTITDIGVGAGMVLKAISHATLAVMSALFGTYNGAVLTTAVTGQTVAAGINSVNNVAGGVPLVGDVTSGVATLATGLASTFRENAEYTSENRKLLVKGLETRVDNFHPESETFLVPPVANEVGAEVKTTAATAAAA